jgi:hypothetical protein
MTIIWVSVCFNYYIIAFFMKYVPGSIFTLLMASGLAETLMNATSFPLSRLIGIKMTLITGLTITAGGSMALWVSGGEHSAFVYVFIIKCGISLCFCLVFLANSVFFPPNIAASCIGICNFFARFSTIFAPLVSEQAAPIPGVTILRLSLIAV